MQENRGPREIFGWRLIKYFEMHELDENITKTNEHDSENMVDSDSVWVTEWDNDYKHRPRPRTKHRNVDMVS